VRLEDREYRAQYDQAVASVGIAQARLNELERGSRPEEVERARWISWDEFSSSAVTLPIDKVVADMVKAKY